MEVAMGDAETAQIAELQMQLREKFGQLGFPAGPEAERLVHHLAEVAVLGRNLAEHTVPLFLSLAPEHTDSLAHLVASIKWDLDEIRDSISDMEASLIALLGFMQRRAG
jgi:hypothetical protein